MSVYLNKINEKLAFSKEDDLSGQTTWTKIKAWWMITERHLSAT